MKLSRNKVKSNYLFYMILLYLFTSLYLGQNDTYMAFLIICLVTIGISIVHIILCKKLIKVEKLGERKIVVSKNNKVEAKIRIYNKMWIQTPYIYIFMNPTFHVESLESTGVCIAIPPRSYKDVYFTYNAKYSGKEIISLDKVIVQDYIGIIKSEVKVTYEKVINILPEIVNVKTIGRITQSMSLNQTEGMQSKNNGLGEPSYELAPYKEGDSMKLIHWKLFARRDIWMVREREKMITQYRKFTLIMDPVYLKLEDRAIIIDKTINIFMTMVNHILDRGDEVTVVYNISGDWENVSVVNKTSLTKLGQILSGYNGMLDKIESRWPGRYLEKIDKKDSPKIFITPKLDLQEMDELERNNNLEVVSIIPTNMLEESSISGWYLSKDDEVNRYV